MRILLVGANDKFAIENYYFTNLEDDGWTVSRFASSSMFYSYYRKNIFNKIAFKIGISNIYKSLNKKLITNIKQIQPDVIWIFKGMEIFPETLNWIRTKNILLVNYNPDNPFLFSGKGSGNLNITQSIKLYDLHFTYNQDIMNQLEVINPGNVKYLPFGFELSLLDYFSCCKEIEIKKVCFVGNPDLQRAIFINTLAAKGIEIDVYGNNWSKFINQPTVSIFSEVGGIEFWKTLRKYRVQLNLVRMHSEDSHNMRTFEVTGVGGIMLAKDTTEHRMFFSEGIETWYYKDIDSCVLAINHLLTLDQKSAEKIREAVRLRSLSSGYQYSDRAKMVSTILKQYLKIK